MASADSVGTAQGNVLYVFCKVAVNRVESAIRVDLNFERGSTGSPAAVLT
jgi:hypothetical protein